MQVKATAGRIDVERLARDEQARHVKRLAGCGAEPLHREAAAAYLALTLIADALNRQTHSFEHVAKLGNHLLCKPVTGPQACLAEGSDGHRRQQQALKEAIERKRTAQQLLHPLATRHHEALHVLRRDVRQEVDDQVVAGLRKSRQVEHRHAGDPVVAEQQLTALACNTLPGALEMHGPAHADVVKLPRKLRALRIDAQRPQHWLHTRRWPR